MNTDNLQQLIARAFNGEPVLIAPVARPQIETLLVAGVDIDIEAACAEADDFCAATFGIDGPRREDKPYLYADGMAFIPVQGALLHRFNSSYSGATGYNYISRLLATAVADPDVKGIVLDVNSYGGQVAGNFELADRIHAARKTKPVMAVVDTMAYSGGYSLASAAGRVVASPSAGVGSIGVVTMHASFEKLMDNAGIKVSFVYAGEQKIDGNPYQDLPKDVKARWQKRIDKSYAQFVSLVARNRGMKEQAVRDTEAGTFDADEALSLGLIDAVQTPTEALAAFRNELSGSNTNRSMTMSNTQTPGAETVAEQAPDTKAIVTAERARIAAIINHDEAKGRSALASKLAMETEMSVEQAVMILSAAAKEQPAAAPAAPAPASSASAFERAMSEGNPDVGAGASAPAPSGQEDAAAAMLKAYSMATGWKPPAASRTH